MVRKGGLEPPHLSVPDPKSGASANSATFACKSAVKNSTEGSRSINARLEVYLTADSTDENPDFISVPIEPYEELGM